MRVLHVIPSVAPAHGGPSRAMALMHQALEGAGVTVEVATTDDDGPGRRLPVEEIKTRYARTVMDPGGIVACHVFPKRTEFYKLAPALGRWLNRHVVDYDLVHIHALFSYSSLVAAWAAQRGGVPCLVRPLGTLTRYGIEQRRPWLKQASLRWLEGPLLSKAAAVHFTAEAERVEANLLGIPFRSVVIPLAVEEEAEPRAEALFSRFPALKDAPYALFLSRLDPKKNVEAFLSAAALLAPEFPTLQFAVVGDGEPSYVEKLKQRAVELRLADRVVWTGFMSGSLKSAVLKHASLFVLPSFSENFGIAAAEALLAGLPCVLGRGVAIAAEVQQAGAGLAIEPNAEATAAAIRHFLNDDDAHKAAGLAARKFAQSQYSLDAMGANLRALYEDILRVHRSQIVGELA